MMIKAIENRRSIRKYNPRPVPREMIEEILKAGMAAPSSKNRQPWRFVVAAGRAKDDALDCMAKGLEREKISPFIPESADYLKGAEATLEIMKSAPIVIFVINPLAAELRAALSVEDRISDICNAQSVGAAMENMTLTATELGLGSLWICDTFFAYRELCDWLHADGELYAAMAVGYAEEAPSARPRNKWENVVEWRS